MSITDTKTQYKTPSNFKSRGNLHAKYASQNWQLWLAQRIDIPDHSDVVDIGCGTGGFWRAAVDTYPESLSLTLLDSAEAMPDEAVKTVTSAGHYRAVRGVLANAMQLPFEGGRFDALCICSITCRIRRRPWVKCAECCAPADASPSPQAGGTTCALCMHYQRRSLAAQGWIRPPQPLDPQMPKRFWRMGSKTLKQKFCATPMR